MTCSINVKVEDRKYKGDRPSSALSYPSRQGHSMILQERPWKMVVVSLLLLSHVADPVKASRSKIDYLVTNQTSKLELPLWWHVPP
ncbi:hypothetical protein YC2023_075792 [Brassica napus]